MRTVRQVAKEMFAKPTVLSLQATSQKGKVYWLAFKGLHGALLAVSGIHREK
jgi:hypothetical protein